MGFDVTMLALKTKCKLVSPNIAQKGVEWENQTIARDEIMKYILEDNTGFYRISVSPHGHTSTGSLCERIMHGTGPFPADYFPITRPYARKKQTN